MTACDVPRTARPVHIECCQLATAVPNKRFPSKFALRLPKWRARMRELWRFCRERAEMWWITFRDGTAVIIEAASLAHARMLAAVHQLGRVAQFAAGYRLSPELAAMVPDDCVGRLLSRDVVLEASSLAHARIFAAAGG